jgi:peptide deformylase
MAIFLSVRWTTTRLKRKPHVIMMLPIAQLGQPILRRVADPVPVDQILTSEFQALLADMRATLTESGGVGLAAPQVFVSLRVFLALPSLPADGGQPPPAEVFINPRLEFPSDEHEAAWEGCLSFPELLVRVSRSTQVRLSYLDASGEQRILDLQGFPARVAQHEADHLDGVLTIDRAASTHDIIKASEIDAL